MGYIESESKLVPDHPHDDDASLRNRLFHGDPLEQNGDRDRFPAHLVPQAENLLWRLVLALHAQSIGVVADQGAVDHESLVGRVLVKMAAEILMCRLRDVPRVDRLHHGDMEPSHAPAVADGVTMMEAHGLPVDVQVAVVAVTYQKRNPLLTGEMLCHRVIHEGLEAVPHLRCRMDLGCNPAVITRMARNDDAHVRMRQKKLNPTYQ